jgi:hypothetical protein
LLSPIKNETNSDQLVKEKYNDAAEGIRMNTKYSRIVGIKKDLG